MIRSCSSVAAGAFLAAGALFLGASSASAQAVALTSGHVDIGAAYESGGFFLHFHDEDTDAEYGPAAPPFGSAPNDTAYAVVLHPEAQAIRPAGAQWDFLGVGAGQPVWILPQTQNPNLLFLGIATEELVSGDWVGDTVTWRMTGLIPPSAGQHFSLYQTDGFGNPTVLFDSSDGIGGDDVFNQAVGSHAHFNFAFTSQGLWGVTLSLEGTHVTDGFVTDSATFYFNVTPEPGTLALMIAGAAGAVGLTGRRRRGDSGKA